MARTGVEVKTLSWDLPASTVQVTLNSLRENNAICLKVGLPWTRAMVNGSEVEIESNEQEKHIELLLSAGVEVTVIFNLRSVF
ncbi:hypothetical protein D3C80_1969200 [compost metagenome]